MTAQEAAYTLLNESKAPMTAMALARLALERRLVVSNAKKKTYSIAQTIEKNVRDDTYNSPRLKFVFENGTRMLALPEWEDTPHPSRVSEAPVGRVTELTAQIPADVSEQIQLAVQSKIAQGFDSTVTLLLRRGLASEANGIRDGLMKQLSQLNRTERSED